MQDILDSVVAKLQAPKGHVQRRWLIQISEATGVPYGTLKKIATGVTTDPRISTISALDSYLHAAKVS